MSYIGVQPTAGQYRKLDNISSGFNGSTTSFTTSVSGTNVTAGTAQQLLVSLGGVIQQPDTDYTVSTNTITFTTAPTSGLTFFAVLMGDALNTVSVSDGAITTAKLAGSLSVGLADGTVSAPSLYFTGDANCGIYSPSDDQLAITTNGVERVEFGTSEVVFNDGGADIDFRIEGDTNANLFFVDAGNDRVGIGESAPESLLHLKGSSATLKIENSVNTGYSSIEFDRAADDTHFAIYAYDSSHATQANNVQFYGYQAGRLDFHTNSSASPRLSIASGGNVGIGTTSAQTRLHVKSGAANYTGGLYLESSANDTGLFISNDGTTSLIQSSYLSSGSYTPLAFWTGGAEKARLDTSGRLLLGTSSAYVGYGGSSSNKLQIAGSQYTDAGLSAFVFGSTAYGGYLNLGLSRNTTVGSHTVVQSGDALGGISFNGSDGTTFKAAADIHCYVDGTPGTNDMPGRLVFSTTADGASSPTERMRIQSDGYINIGNPTRNLAATGISLHGTNDADSYFAVSTAASVLALNRQGSDGDLIRFFQANAQEGVISVSGSTVTYGGGHLARWSQLPNDEDPSTLLKGTVMSNLDEMCEWDEEANEQLNKTKVSNVEGDPNVAGVFVATSPSEDGPLDFFVGMTGDMIIRIGAGVTVERGDLLMSAGDGTAKPQDDDIIRSKTIAKVTSTNVSCTYEDGSYCVPCVLMAC